MEAIASTAAKRVVLFKVEDMIADLVVEEVMLLKRVAVIECYACLKRSCRD